MLKTIVSARHAQAVGQGDGHDKDRNLVIPTGKNQARALDQKLRSIGIKWFDLVVTSPAERSADTGSIATVDSRETAMQTLSWLYPEGADLDAIFSSLKYASLSTYLEQPVFRDYAEDELRILITGWEESTNKHSVRGIFSHHLVANLVIYHLSQNPNVRQTVLNINLGYAEAFVWTCDDQTGIETLQVITLD